MLGGPAAGVARSRLPQVVLEAHLPSFAAASAAAEPPQAAGRAPQQPAALAGERGQVVHAAARRHGSLRAAAAARQRPPSLPSRGQAALRLQASGAGRASSGPGRTIGPLVGGACELRGTGKCCFAFPRSGPGRASLQKVLVVVFDGFKVGNAWNFKSPAPVLAALPHRPAAVEQPAPPLLPRPAPSRSQPDFQDRRGREDP